MTILKNKIISLKKTIEFDKELLSAKTMAWSTEFLDEILLSYVSRINEILDIVEGD